MVLIELDDHMQALAVGHQLGYTRYADDLTFSGQDFFDVSADVQSAVANVGFELNPAKTKRFKHGQPMFVTGLSVSDGRYPRVRKRLKSRLRQEFFYIEKFGLQEHAAVIGENPIWTASRITGEYHYCRTVEPDFARALALLYPAAHATVAPEHEDTRAERAQRHRETFLSEVAGATAQSLPFYIPSVSMLAE